MIVNLDEYFFYKIPEDYIQDPDGHSLTYNTLSTLPVWVFLEENSGAFSGFPVFTTTHGNVSVSVYATDPYGLSSSSITFYFIYNRPPNYNTTTGAVNGGKIPTTLKYLTKIVNLISFAKYFSDPDSDSLRYTLE